MGTHLRYAYYTIIKVDIWAFGVILYGLLVGRMPFETANIKNTYQRITNAKYHIPSDNTISQSSRMLISQILLKNPHMRLTLDEIQNSEFMFQQDDSCETTLLNVKPNNNSQETIERKMQSKEQNFEEKNCSYDNLKTEKKQIYKHDYHIE